MRRLNTCLVAGLVAVALAALTLLALYYTQPMWARGGAAYGAAPAKTAPESLALQAPALESGSLPVAPRNITYTASLWLEVADVEGAVGEVEGVAAQLGGYTASVDFQEGAAAKATVVVKVPAEKYREALDRLSKVGRVKSLSEKAVDVTNQWIDLSARLRNLRAEEDRLLQLLERATSISDVLAIEDRLAAVRYQAEFYEAQLRSLERSINYATVTVTLTPTVKPVEWPELDLAGAAVQGVKLAVGVVLALVTAVVGLSPLAVIGGAAYYAYRRLRASGMRGSGSRGTPSSHQA